MPIKIKLSKQVQDLLDTKSNKGLVPQVRKEFSKRGPVKTKQAIIQDMIKGISPVNGKGKFVKYSDSYKDVIKNRAAYRMVKGKVVRFSTDDVFGFSDRQFGSLRPDRAARRSRSTAKSTLRTKIKDLNKDFHDKSNPTKQISPVNLRHSGGLHKDFNVFTKGGFLRAYRLVLEFRNKLADIHNRLGAGKSKTIRRLLPTRSGERFNRRIAITIISELNKAANRVAKQFSRQ